MISEDNEVKFHLIYITLLRIYIILYRKHFGIQIVFAYI